MAELADKLRGKTLTVGEALDLATKDAPESRVKNIKGFSNKLKKLGIEESAPFSSIGEASNLELLAKEAGQPFAALTTVQNAINGAAAAQDIEPPFPDYSAKAQSAGLIGGKQKRGTKKFEAVPEAKITLPAITKAIAQVEDPQTRSALALNALIPLRPGEIASMTLDDIDLETGMLEEKVRGQKTRAKIKVPGVALEIIKDAAELAEQEGRSNIFDTTVGKMSKAINAPGGLRDLLKPYASEMGREIQGAADFRKLIPSIIASELGYAQEASEIMGHTSAGQTLDSLAKMSSEHYVSRILRQGEESRPTIALRALQNMYGEVLGLSTLNELPASLNVSAKGIELSNEAIPIVREEGDILETTEPRQLTADEKQLIEERRRLASQQVAAQTAEAEAAEQAARTRAQEERLKQAELTPEQEKKLARQRLVKREATKQVQAEEKAADEAATKEARKEEGRKNIQLLKDAFGKLGPVAEKGVKALPFIAAGSVLSEGVEAAERGEYGLAARRTLQAGEELLSPLPVTTRDIEEVQPTEPRYGSRTLGETLQRGLEKTGRSISEQTSELFDRN